MKNDNEVKVLNTNLQMAQIEIDTQVATAKQYPRNLEQCLKNAMFLATSSQEIAESCLYVLPRGQKKIEGPSVRLAEIVASQFQNLRTGYRIIENDGKTITAQGVCHDLENNYMHTANVSRRITYKNGKTFDQDMQVVTGNAAGAIAFRNALFKVIPAALISPIYEKAKEIAKGDNSTLVSRTKSAVAWFYTKGIKAEKICEFLSIISVEEIDLDMLQTLSGMKSAVVNDKADIKELFGMTKKEEVAEKKQAMKDKQEANEKTDANGQGNLDMK